MSARAQKSARRLVNLREQALNSVSAWDDTAPLERNSVFVRVDDVEAFLERIDNCIQQQRLDKLEHLFVDGGVLVRFRRKRDADRFRQTISS